MKKGKSKGANRPKELPKKPKKDPRFAGVKLQRTVGQNLPEMVSTLVVRSAYAGLAELVANAYDADAENVYITYDSGRDLLIVEDDGSGMSPEGLQAFYRLGDSVKLQERISPGKNRPRLGRFGVATLVIKSLAKSYSLSTKRDGLETIVEEDLTKPLTADVEIPFSTNNTDPKKHGTKIVMRNLNITEGKGFSIKELRKRVQTEFRRLTTLPDFSVHINGENIKPAIIDNAVKFDINEQGNYGPVRGTIYLTNTSSQMRGLHLSVNGRNIGDPRVLLEQATDNLALRNRVVGEITADGLAEAVLFDRAVFRQDHPAFIEVMGYVTKTLSEVRTYGEGKSKLSRGLALEKSRPQITAEVKRRLAIVAPEKIRKASISFTNNPAEDAPACEYNPKTGQLTFNQGVPPLVIGSSTNRAEYVHALTVSAIEALAMQEVQGTSEGEPLDVFLSSRREMMDRLSKPVGKPETNQKIYPSVVYSIPEIVSLTGISLGGMRYLANSSGLLRDDGGVLGKDYLNVAANTLGMINLYEFLAKDAGSNMDHRLKKFTDIFGELGPRVTEPFVTPYNGGQCYFVEGACARGLRVLFSGDDFSRLLAAADPRAAFTGFASKFLKPAEITRECDGLTLDNVSAIIAYAQQLPKNPLEFNGDAVKYNGFVRAMQHMRGNRKQLL